MDAVKGDVRSKRSKSERGQPSKIEINFFSQTSAKPIMPSPIDFESDIFFFHFFILTGLTGFYRIILFFIFITFRTKVMKNNPPSAEAIQLSDLLSVS